MESLTKNRQSRETVQKIAEKFFPDDRMAEYEELTEGYFNVAYEITLLSGRSVILKVAPSDEVPVMSYEKNIMFAETESMKMAAANPDIPVPLVYGYDDSRSICPSPYFLMEKLRGNSLYSIRENLPEENINAIKKETGEVNRRINEIICPRFGLPGQQECQGEEWFPVFRRMMEMGIEDAEARAVDLKVSAGEILECLEKDRRFFEEVKTPCLVHWDIWAGNIFTDGICVTGIIDWERSLWGDPLLEVGFRTFDVDICFRKGYGKERLTESEERRALWYDVYMAVLQALECEYMHYDTMEMYERGVRLLGEQMKRMRLLQGQQDR